MRLLIVIAGGGLGSAARYLAGLWLTERFGGFPWGTLTVNIVGSFLIGVLATLADEAGSIKPEARLFLVVGVLGGFTTFSSFSLDALRLVDERRPGAALLYVLASVALSLTATLLGMLAARSLN